MPTAEHDKPRPADPAQRGSSEPGPAPTPEPLQGFRDRFVIVRRDGREEPVDAPELVHLPGGIFRMGDDQGGSDERPVHRVRLPAFALGRTPVTWGDYRRFCEATDGHWPEWLEAGSQYHLETGGDDYYAKRGVGREALDLPVVGVSRADARAYCEWLRERTGKPYRLPTEAEWEYACRAETQTRWSFGDDEAKLGDYAWYAANSEGRLHPIAQKRPNPWGLYDMHGNVWEWCADWYASDYYEQLASAASKDPIGRHKSKTGPSLVKRISSALGIAASGAPMDTTGAELPASEGPSGPESGSLRVVRGGSWNFHAVNCRSAYRNRIEPSYRYHILGFRLSRTV